MNKLIPAFLCTVICLISLAIGCAIGSSFVPEAPIKSDLVQALENLPPGYEVIYEIDPVYETSKTVTPTESAKKVVRATETPGMWGNDAVDAVLGDKGIQTEGLSVGYQDRAIAAAKDGSNILIFAGIAFAAAGVLVMAFLSKYTLGMILVLAGAAFITIGIYPWLLLIGVVVVVGLIGYLVYTTWKSGRAEEALKSIIGGIEAAPEKAAEVVKAEIEKKANGGATKDVVGAVKKSL
jgi:hypothetical protein